MLPSLSILMICASASLILREISFPNGGWALFDKATAPHRSHRLRTRCSGMLGVCRDPARRIQTGLSYVFMKLLLLPLEVVSYAFMKLLLPLEAVCRSKRSACCCRWKAEVVLR